ncbi:MAG: hypothetical protein CMK07_08815, partial [Ponticaulis sp.]|nr:hypothetical protein [Ponticaulis sp.]
MALYVLGSTTTGYIVADDTSSYLVRDGYYIGHTGSAIFASGSSTNNDYTIDGYVIGGPNSNGIYLTGKNGGLLGINSIHVGTSGMITAGRGIYATQERLMITNQGTISGDQYDGIYHSALDDSVDHRVVNLGLITGYHDGIEFDANYVVIENSGTISGRYSAIDVGGHSTLINSGTVSSGTSRAFYSYGEENLIHNSGNMVSAQSDAIVLSGSYNDIVNTSTGTIQTSQQNTDHGIYIYAGTSNTLTNDGVISAGGLGVFFNRPTSGYGEHTLVNSGTITSNSSTAVDINGGAALITNTGLIRSFNGNGI